LVLRPCDNELNQVCLIGRHSKRAVSGSFRSRVGKHWGQRTLFWKLTGVHDVVLEMSVYENRVTLISIVTLDILLTTSNFSTTCQLSVIRVLVGCSRLLG